jgi:hypothetical protein
MVHQKNKVAIKDDVFKHEHLHPRIVPRAEYDHVDLHQERYQELGQIRDPIVW